MTPEEKQQRNREACRKYDEKNRDQRRQSARDFYAKHREKELERQRKWREKNLELKRQIMKEFARRRRAEHPEKTRAIQRKVRMNESPERRENRLKKIREWHDQHKDEMREYQRKYNQEQRNLEMERVRSANRKAWYRQAAGTFSASDIASLYEKQDGKCAHCGHVFPKTGTHRFQIDHIIPLKPRGAIKPVGTNNPDNLQLLCRKCNRAKSNRLP